MLINQEFINHLTPVEVSFIRIGIEKLYKEKVRPDTTNYENVSSHVECCPHCGSVHFVKNGFNPHHRQKYRCKDCNAVFMATTGTMFTHSKTNFDTWSTFIAGELNSLTLEQQSIATGLSKTTCFNMRHKLYQAASRVQNQSILSGEVELDPTYSKHRGKGRYRKQASSGNTLLGLNHHKVCIVAAIDEHDNMFFKVGGLGRETFDILNITLIPVGEPLYICYIILIMKCFRKTHGSNRRSFSVSTADSSVSRGQNPMHRTQNC